jgi:hypothetical protein
MESDVMLYVVGSAEENEVLLYRYGHGMEIIRLQLTATSASS